MFERDVISVFGTSQGFLLVFEIEEKYSENEKEVSEDLFYFDR